MTNFDVPELPSEFVEAMLRSSIEADLLCQENINDHRLREAHIHSAVNGFIAAMAMEALLRGGKPGIASDLGEHLQQILTAGDIAGPAYRAAKALGHDPDQWIAAFNERAARRGAKPEAGRRATHIALADLAERWEQMAGPKPDPSEGLFVDEVTPAESARVERAATYREAASDVRDVLRTGRLPHPLMTDAELEQHGTPEEAAS